MSLIDLHAKQEVSLERQTRDEDGGLVLNDYSEPTFDDAETILASYQPRSGLRRSATGDDTDAESTVITATEIKLGDRIEGSPVRRVEPMIGLDGVLEGYEAFL